jgi:hypothetical protein
MQNFISFRGLRPLGPHQGFALDPMRASMHPQTPYLLLPPPPPGSEISGSATNIDGLSIYCTPRTLILMAFVLYPTYPTPEVHDFDM